MDLHGLSFSPGLKIQEEIWDRFKLPVTRHALNPASFAPVLAVGRCKLRLLEDSVSQILQATIGGIAAQFKTELLRDRSFKFCLLQKGWPLHLCPPLFYL